jgi:hypothetical protein
MLRVLYQLFRRGNSLYYRDFQLKFIRIIVIIESMMLILAYDSYFEKKDSQVILVKKCPKDSQPLRIMILIKKNECRNLGNMYQYQR